METPDRVIFEGSDIRVRYCPFEGSRDLLVTFTGRSSKPPAAKGFGEEFFKKRGMSAVHLISKANHWWQTDEIDAAIQSVRDHCLSDGPRNLILYGSSMGGFAALIRSGSLPATSVIAISPQYSIDARTVPFEKRWRHYAAKLTFDHDDMPAGLDRNIPVFVIIDPLFNPDMQHARMIERLRPIDRIAVPFAGHNTARLLEECGLMQRLIVDLTKGRFVRQSFADAYRARKFGASLFWFGLSAALIEHGRRAWSAAPATLAAHLIVNGARMRDKPLRGEILRLALDIALDRDDVATARRWWTHLKAEDPEGRMTILREARCAVIDRSPDEAVALARRAFAMREGDGDALAVLIQALVRADQIDCAIDLARRGQADFAHDATVLSAVCSAQRAAGDRALAMQTVRMAEQAGIENAAFRLMLAWECVEAGDRVGAQRQLMPLIHGTIASPRHVERIVELGQRIGLEAEATRFTRRCERADFLYQQVVASLDTVLDRDLAGSMAGLVRRVADALPGRSPRGITMDRVEN